VSITAILEKLFSLRNIIAAALIFGAIALTVYFKPITVKYSECRVTDNGYTLVGHEYRIRTVISKDGGAVMCLKQIVTQKTKQNNLVEKVVSDAKI
jgi:hypothetical protein